MGRKKLVEKILESIDEKDEKGTFVIIYDFIGGRNPKEFYYALQDLRSKGYLIMQLQKSVLQTNSRVCALAIKELVEHYRGTCKVFKVEREL